MNTLRTLKILIPLTMALGVSMMAEADPAKLDQASLLKTPFHTQSTNLLQLAQMPSDEDMCVSKCEEELEQCRESDQDESECSAANKACQEACAAE